MNASANANSTESTSQIRAWLDKVAGLNPQFLRAQAVQRQRQRATGSDSTHHAMSAASSAALNSGDGQANGDGDKTGDSDDENRFCGRRGCPVGYMHAHMDKKHMASAHNRKRFFENEFL